MSTREDPRLTYGIEEAGAKAGLGSYASRKAAADGVMPIIRIGRFLRVPKKKWDRILNGEEAIAEPISIAPVRRRRQGRTGSEAAA